MIITTGDWALTLSQQAHVFRELHSPAYYRLIDIDDSLGTGFVRFAFRKPTKYIRTRHVLGCVHV